MTHHKPNLGLLPWVTVQCGLPHSRQRNPDGSEVTFYERVNGRAHLSLLAHPRVGLPYGKLPRLLLVHLVAQYKRNRAHLSPEEARIIDLGPSCRAILRRLGMDDESKAYARFKDQARRLLTADIQSCEESSEGHLESWWFERQPVADSARLWWHPHAMPDVDAPNVHHLFPNYIELSPKFAKACESAVPVDVDKMIAMRSPFAIDLYAWLSYRSGKLHEQGAPSTDISWKALQQQFGHSYRRVVDFRRAFRKHLRTVLDHYPAQVDHQNWSNGIVVYSHPPDIPQRQSE